MLEWPAAITVLTALIGATLAIITANRRFLRDAKQDLRDEVKLMRAADIEEVQIMAETFRDGLEVLEKHLRNEIDRAVEDDGEGVIVDGVWQPYDGRYPPQNPC